MTRPFLRFTALLGLATLLLAACRGESGPTAERREGGANLGVDPAKLSPIVDNPYFPLASGTRAIYEGKEFDPDTGEAFELRVEASVRDANEKVSGIEVTVVDISEFEDGELVEKTEDYYAQDTSGSVYYIGEKVDDFEGGKLIGHEGQWRAGQNGARAGEFMPAAPKVGDVFEQERAPGVAEDRSEVVDTGVSVTVPAGTFDDCIETEDLDPISGQVQNKFYCRGVGLVQEVFPDGGGGLDLIEFATS
jgi:hypothetical protein